MLTWDNFEFVKNEGYVELYSIPRFGMLCPLDYLPEKDALIRMERAALNMLHVILHTAVKENKYYMSKRELVGNVWEHPCTINALPLHKQSSLGVDKSFRASEGVVVKVISEKPSEEGFESYKDHLWYRVKDDTVECALMVLISNETDQSKLGRV